MIQVGANKSVMEGLLAARRIADVAKNEGINVGEKPLRSTSEHLGVVLADSILQAGLNYTTVVRPRVMEILQAYPDRTTVSSLVELIKEGRTGIFLKWRHREKIARFEGLVYFLSSCGIEGARDLRLKLKTEEFCHSLQSVSGIGPKTVDYMACLVGIDSIAVDRHVRAFAKMVGVERDDYHFLRQSFCWAADFLSLPRREFDAWLWRRSAMPSDVQLALDV